MPRGEYPRLEAIEQQVRADVADVLRSARHRWPNLGITVFVSHLGAGQGIAYGSTIRREDMSRALIEFLHRVALAAESPEIRQAAADLYAATRRPGDDG